MASQAILEIVANVTGNAESKLGGLLGGLAKLGLAGAGVGVIKDAVGGVIDTFGDLAGAAADEKLGMDKLVKTTKNAIPTFDGNTDALDAAIKAGEDKAFADDQVRDSLGLLIGKYHDVTKAQDVQNVAMDLARAKGLSLDDATKLLLGTASRQATQLEKMGISIDKTGDETTRFGQIQAATAGQADLFADSSAGAAQRTAEAFQNAKEDIGSALLPLQEQILGGFASFLEGDTFQGAITFVKDLLGNQLPKAIDFLSGAFAPVMTVLQTLGGYLAGVVSSGNTFNQFLSELPAPLQPIAQLLGSLIANWQTFFGALGSGQDIITSIADLLSSNLQAVLSTLGIPQETIDQIVNFLGTAIPAAVQLAIDAWNNVLLPALNMAWTFITQNVIPALGDLLGWLATNLPPAIQALADFWTTTLQPALAQVWQFVQDNIFPLLGDLLGWIKDQIPPAMVTLAQFWTDTLQPALAQVWQFMTDNVFPALGDLLGWLKDNIPPALQTLADFWNNILQPAIAAVWQFLTDNVFPALGTLLAWLKDNIPPALQTLADFWNNTLKPALSNVWSFIQDNVIPILKDVLTWLKDNIPPAIQGLADLWNNTLKPALQALWDFINNNLLPVFKSLVDLGVAVAQKALEALAGLWEKVISPALNALWSFIDTNLTPVFKTFVSDGLDRAHGAMDALATIWNTVLSPALKTAADFIGGALKTALDGIGSALDTVKGLFDDLASAVNSLTLPDWLTPGSPTPLEYGLLGIKDALKDINSGSLATFAADMAGVAKATADTKPDEAANAFATSVDVVKASFDPSNTDGIAAAFITGWENLTKWFRYTWSVKFLDILKITLTDIRLAIQGQAAGFNQAGAMLGDAVIQGMLAAINGGAAQVAAATAGLAGGTGPQAPYVPPYVPPTGGGGGRGAVATSVGGPVGMGGAPVFNIYIDGLPVQPGSVRVEVGALDYGRSRGRV